LSKSQINVHLEEEFLEIVDEAAGLTGATRSDFVRQALLQHCQELLGDEIYAELKRGKGDG